MNLINLLASSSLSVIGGADGPTVIAVSGDLPIPAILVSVFAVGFILYVYIAKAVASKKAPVAVQAVATPAATVNAYTGPVITDIEDKEAAVIMAIVSYKTGIPLERLRFGSIKLMEDK